MKKVVIAVGGTGGHLFPALSLYQELMRKEKEFEILFAGAGLSESPYFDAEEVPFVEIRSATPSRKGLKNKLAALRQIGSGTKAAFSLLRKFKPDLVIGFGSFHCAPLLFAAKLLRIPYILHEGNAYPGKVTRFFSKGAKVTAVQFPEAQKYLKGKAQEVAPLIREGFSKLFGTKQQARESFGLDPDKFTFLVFGGSQGARQINEMFLSVLQNDPSLSKGALQVLHLTGDPVEAKRIENEYREMGITSYVRPFETKMDQAYLAADLVISRAGASSLLEQLQLEIPSILIPYQYAADNHQLFNAAYMTQEVGGSVMIAQNEETKEKLGKAIRQLAGAGRTSLTAMEERMKAYKKGRGWKPFSELIFDQLGMNIR